jgi:hypothetical protein
LVSRVLEGFEEKEEAGRRGGAKRVWLEREIAIEN